MTEITNAIARIRKFLKSHPEMTLGGFALRAGLHRNTLYGLTEGRSWNPTAETLDKCLQAIDNFEASWEAGVPPKRSKKSKRPEAAVA